MQNVTDAYMYMQTGQAVKRLENRSDVHMLELLDIRQIDSMKLPLSCGRCLEDYL